jgi:hypothetical protein
MYVRRFLKLFHTCGNTERKKINPKIECTAAVVRLYGRKKESKPDIDKITKLIAKVRLTQIRYRIV